VAEHICAQVPHRQFVSGAAPAVRVRCRTGSSCQVPHRQVVFTIPKRLRIYFRFDRRLLGDPCRAAARTVINRLQAVGCRL
jgi:hypothetical protein